VVIELHEHEPPPLEDGRLYRALRADVRYRFVVVAPGPGYDVADEDGDPDGAGGVVLVEPFAVPPGDDERFLAAWREAHAALAAQRGYLGARLYRSAAPGEPRWVETARWSSPLMYSRAGGDGALYLSVPG
jgi:Antibiotic biosynthesis monooxygenase